MKELSKFEIAAIKRTAQNVNAMVTKKTKLKEKIDALQAEYNQIEEAQEQFEAPIRRMTGGYSTEDLVEKVIEDTGKLDKEGKSVKITKYVLKYPETAIPVESKVEELEVPVGTVSFEEVEHGTDTSDLPFMN